MVLYRANLMLVAALCLAGCQRPVGSASVAAPSAAPGAISIAAIEDIECAVQQAGLEHARYSRGLDPWERELLAYMVTKGVPAGPDTDVPGILAAQVVTGPVIYSNNEDRSQPWKFCLCYGNLFRGQAPAVIEATGPDPDDHVLITATLTIRPGRVDSLAIRRADGEQFAAPWPVQSPDHSYFNENGWRVGTHGSVDSPGTAPVVRPPK